MARKIVDISKYINAEQPEIVLFGKTYNIKNDKKTILLMNELNKKMQGKGVEADEKVLTLLLGEEGGKEVLEVLDSSPNYAANEQAVLLNVIALATGKEYEELEAQFRKQQEQ